MIHNVKGIITYLTAQGWDVKKSTIYRHVDDHKLKKNKTGAFDIIAVGKYAKKYLKRIDVMNENSQKAELGV